MDKEDYPWLYQASDEASVRAQKWYFRFLKVQLGLFLLVSALGVGSGFLPTGDRKVAYPVIAIALGIALILMLIGREKQFDRLWFDCRAVAESAKSASWRFVMRAEPFDKEEHVESSFIKELEKILQARPDVRPELSGRASSTKAISNTMRNTRQMNVDQRKEKYIKERLGEQQDWYETEAKTNRSGATLWYWVVIGVQLVALATAIALASTESAAFNPVSFLMTVAAVFTGWNQARRHNELASSYALAAQELRQLEGLAEQVKEETEFRALVEDSEEAVSREHTMWCVHRSVLR